METIISNDLVELEPFTIDLPIIFLDENTLTNEQKFTHLYHHLQRYTWLKQR